MISFRLPAGPTRAVRISGVSSFEGCEGEAKSARVGPVLRRSRKVVGRRRVVGVGGAVGEVGSETAVAKERGWRRGGEKGCRVGACKERRRVALDAIAYGKRK